MSAQEQYRAFIRNCPYFSAYRDRIVNELIGLSSSFPLQPKLMDIAEGSRAIRLCTLDGTLPITISAQSYYIPIKVIFTERYPMSAPQILVCPAPNMNIKVSQYVNERGEITHAGLTGWTNKSSLRQILQELQGIFAQQCPVYINANYQIKTQTVEDVNARILAIYERMKQAVVEECKGWEATKQRLREHSNILQAQLQQSLDYQYRARAKADQLNAGSKALEEKLVQAAYQPSLNSSQEDLQPRNPLHQALLTLVASERAVTDTIFLLEQMLSRWQGSPEAVLKELKLLYAQQFLLQKKQEKAANEILCRR